MLISFYKAYKQGHIGNVAKDLQTLSVRECSDRGQWSEGKAGHVSHPGQGSRAIPARQTAGKLLADACCCASMQRSVASADIIVMEGEGTERVTTNLHGVWRGGCGCTGVQHRLGDEIAA